MYVCRIYVCTCVRTYVRTYVHACTQLCTYVHTTHARTNVSTHACIHTCTHPLPVCACTVCSYTCVTIFNYAEVLVLFAEDRCNLRSAEIHASQLLQIQCTTATQTMVKARGLYKHGAQSNLDTAATMSIPQRQSSSASAIGRLQFLRCGPSILESSATCCAI